MAYSAINENFVIASNLLTATGEVYDLSKSVTFVAIKRNFSDNSFPLFTIRIRTTTELKNTIQNDNIRISLQISKYDQEFNDSFSEDSEEVYIKNIILDTIIRPYTKPFIPSDTKTDEDSEENGNSIENSVNTVFYEISGIPEDLINLNKTVINEVYANASMNEICLNVLSKASNKTIFIESSDNKKREKTLLIPPLSPVLAIKFLQQNYSIYKSPLTLFFDTDKTYLIPSLRELTQYNRNFKIDLKSINEVSDNSVYSRPVFEDNGTDIKLFLRTLPNFNDSSRIIDNEKGSSTVYYSYDDNFNLNIRRISSQDSTEYEKVRYFWNQGREKIFEDDYNNTLNCSKSTSISLTNIDPYYFSPATKITISGSEISELNGLYHLTENSVIFSTNDYLHYSSTNVINIIKNKLSENA